MSQQTHITVTLSPEIRLGAALINAGIKRPASVRKLTINGMLSLTDFHFIHTKMRRTLQVLNMGSASIEDNKIPDWAFNHCIGLISVTIPDTVIEIGKCAFWECTGLSSMIIPDTIEKIGADAFFNCINIGIGITSGALLSEKPDDAGRENIIQTVTGDLSNYQRKWLVQFFPENTLDEVMNMLQMYRIHLKITNPRRSVLGTYIAPHNRNYHVITINSDLNRYEYLEVFLHEYAHLLVRVNHDETAKSHGIEWKNTFRKLLHHFIRKNLFPDDIRSALHKYMVKTYAKSTWNLHTVLRKYGSSVYHNGKIDFCCCCHSQFEEI